MGDQPGNHQWHYLDRWQSLPDGTFIALAKFTNSLNSAVPYTITDSINTNKSYHNLRLCHQRQLPVSHRNDQLAAAGDGALIFPYIAFNYLGQLTFDGQTMASR